MSEDLIDGTAPPSRVQCDDRAPKRKPCQVCGRMLVLLVGDVARYHNSHARHHTGSRCPGSGYRQRRWEVGQELRHHAGDLWLVAEDRGGPYGDYWLRCLAGREQGREMTAHGEYMHRHGWTPA